jgi:hypothetical protein
MDALCGNKTRELKKTNGFALLGLSMFASKEEEKNPAYFVVSSLPSVTLLEKVSLSSSNFPSYLIQCYQVYLTDSSVLISFFQ